MKNKLHGYMTVEAALLMPAVWFSLFFLIFAGFFQYDRCIAEQDIKVIVLRASEIQGKDEAALTRAVMEGESVRKKKLLFSDSVQRELCTTKDKVTLKISGRINTILSSLIKETELRIFYYGAEYEAKKYDPVQVIRVCRRIKDYAGN